MAIYSGWNTLGLGQAINNAKDIANQNRVNAINQGTGALEKLFKAIGEENDKNKMREDAVAYAAGELGQDQARYLASISPELAVSETNNRLGENRRWANDKKVRTDTWEHQEKVTDDERDWQEKWREGQWKRDDEVSADQREWQVDFLEKQLGLQKDFLQGKMKDEFDDWMAKQKFLNKNQAIQATMGWLNNQLMANDTKDWGKSLKGVEIHNNIVKALQTMGKANPDYGGIWNILTLMDSGDKGSLAYIENQDKAAQALIKGGKKTSPEQIENFFKELQISGSLTDFITRQKDWTDVLVSMGDKEKLTPYITTEKVGNGAVTQAQRDNEIAFNDALNALDKAYNDGDEYPENIDESILKQIEDYKDDKGRKIYAAWVRAYRKKKESSK